MEFFLSSSYQNNIVVKLILVVLLLLSVCDDSNSLTCKQFQSNLNQTQYEMGSESEDLDKCFDVVSTVVQKAGDVSVFN